MNRVYLLVVGTTLVGTACIVRGQAPAPSGKIAVEAEPVKASSKKGLPQPEDGPAPTPAKEAKETLRLQKLKQLQFDRRPSVILKAWSHVPGQEPAKKDDKPETKDLEPEHLPRHVYFGNVKAVQAIMTKLLDQELAGFQRQVTLGNWDGVKAYLAKLPAEEGKAGYKQMLQALARDPSGGMEGMMMQGMPPMMMQFMERNKFAPDDVIALAAAAPKAVDKEALDPLGTILRQALQGGHVVEHAVARLQNEIARPKEQAALTKRQAAQLLTAADQASEAGVFLPPLDEAVATKDHEALNLLTRHYLALHAKGKKGTQLEQAWSATQAVLAVGGGSRAEIEEALKRAVEIAPKVREELGQKWLDQSFTSRPQRGMDILATIGSHVAQGMQTNPMGPEVRLKALQLQKTAVTALLRAAPKQAEAWHATLSLLAGNWLKEAEFSYQFDRSTSLGPRMRRDNWGNYYYFNDEEMMPPMMMHQQQNMPRPIVTGELLETRPTDPWLARVDESLKPKVAMLFAQLYLKVGEEAMAFPYIEQLAGKHQEKARDLVREFLRVWTRNHNPNANREYTNPYMFMYGFERRSESIPLTRSKQERNLLELAEWVERLRNLKTGELDEELLAKAFTTCHSSAEVYRMEAIEKVFGPLAALKPNTLAELGQQMRENLGGLWREPAVQKDKKTNRKPKDIQAEVLRGYALARTVIDSGQKKFPDAWSLQQAKSALLHDENNYYQELAKSTEFSPKRQEALAGFQQAAALYAAKVKDIPEDEQTTQVYEQWFYASLGACDLKHVSEDKQPDLRQPALIRKALLALPGEAAERHVGKFANTLFTRLSGLSPACKFRYLKAGFEIVGDHKLAHEARKVYDYYKDLVTEIKLDTVLDGSDAVGHKQAFGVFVNLRHTRDIERESGGFGRYLQNQNSGGYWSYNYGRPTADYRDKFQATVTEALKEHFEVLSVTFQTDKVNSRALPEYGWRYTPYAYVLVKARGPEVDKLPPLRLDLDFLDTSGYVIIPVESATLPLDASVAKGEARPARKVQITQILDERQSDKGKLLLEVKATTLGLAPELDQLLDFKLDGLDIAKTDDHGVSVARFDPDAEQNTVQSERTWLLTLKAQPGQEQVPSAFRFGAAKVDGTEMTYQRYQDADIANVAAEISLEERYGSPSYAWLGWMLAAVFVGLMLVVAATIWLFAKSPPPPQTWKLPDRLTPFTVLGLLKQIQEKNGLGEAQQAELGQSIVHLERCYFAADCATAQDVDLKVLAETWARRAT